MEAVTAIGGAILSASFQELFDRMTSMELLKYAQEGNVLVELKKWERMLKKLYLVLDDAEEKQWENPLVKMWVSDLRDLAYDAEDVLDELATEAQRRKLKVEPLARASKSWKIISTVFACINPNTIKFNAAMVSKIERISTRLDEIVKEKNNLHIVESRGSTSQVRTRLPTTSLVNESKIYGRENDKNKILDLLKKKGIGGNVSVIPIVGMGGVGKTTLAQLIFNDATLVFDLKSWVFVGEDFDVLTMTKTILQSVVCEGTYGEDLNLLQIKLKDKLSQKKFLIVLDDVWTENYDNWTLFCSPFAVGAPGSIIIITTRNESVSSMMGTIRGYSLKQLSHEDCFSVFAQHALGAINFDEHSELEDIGKEIVKRCHGLPLAAKALGGLLRGTANRNIWEEVLNNNIWDLPDYKNNIIPALRLSYLHLPSHLKRCFAYCSIFPKDYEFDLDELVLLWMAEGFLYISKKMKQLKDLGCQYFHDLLSRSFFQQSTRNKSRYVIHDLMHDLAQSVTEETCFHLGEKMDDTNLCTKVRHSSFTTHWYDTWLRFEGFHKVTGLRTFLALPKHYGHLTRKVLQDLMPKLKCLRALSLSGYWIEELPSSISALKHLRYLNLSCTLIKRLPKSVAELLNLQTLILSGCVCLIELPSCIGNLINLQCLDISGTDELKEMPLQIGNLANIHTLTKFIVGKDNGLNIKELKKFPHISGFLHISRIENVLNIREAELANLMEKQRLQELDLEWAELDLNSYGSRDPSDEVQVLNSLRPPQNLLRLSIKSFGGTELPLWIGDPTFSNMARLKLCNCGNITSLPALGQLPSLEELSIQGMNRVKKVGVEFHGNGSSFACLKTLTMQDMLEWEQWSWSRCGNDEAAVTFPNLHKLELRNCPKLSSKLPSCLQSLQELSIEYCQEMVLRSLSDLTSLTILRIHEVSGLVSLHEAHIETLVALDDLRIEACHQLKYLWKYGTSLYKLACLTHLGVNGCEQLVSLIEGEEGQLPCNLQVLKIIGCHNLDKLPNGLHSLTSLRDLIISFCTKLLSFPATRLPYSLRCLEIQGCDSLESLPDGIMCDVNDIKQTSVLETLKICTCRSLMSCPIGEFPASLKTLKIKCCNWRTQLLQSAFHGLSQLRYLSIVDCQQLLSFQETGLPMHSLISLTIGQCENLRLLPNPMHDLYSLKYLYISNCEGLVSFPEGGLPANLTELSISSCGGLEYFPQRGLPPKLTQLSIQYCKNIKQPMREWGLHKLTSLRHFRIYGSSPSTKMFDSFPDADGLLLPTSLTYVKICELENLKSISKGLQKLTSLQCLCFESCQNLLYLPEEGFPDTLEHLIIIGCPHLAERCCKNKGVYWPIISHLPYVET